MEQWRNVVGFEGRYEVSTLGRVRSLRFRGHDGTQIMKLTPNYAGYLVVSLGRVRIQHRVSRLVLEAFVGPCPLDMEACHDDGKKVNNCLTNLRWDTSAENGKDKAHHGVHKGSRNSKAVLTEEDVLHIRTLAFPDLEGLANQYGVTGVSIRNVITRKTWAHL